jgi:hypothetical protein
MLVGDLDGAVGHLHRSNRAPPGAGLAAGVLRCRAPRRRNPQVLPA